MPACSDMVPGPIFCNGVSFYCAGRFSLCFFLLNRFFIMYWQYILRHMGSIQRMPCYKAISSVFWSALCVCPVVRVFFCFTRIFFCVCRYILCHLYYYLMLVRLDCTSCVCKVYLVCIVCGHHGNLSTSHTCGSHDICSVYFLFFALYFVFYLQFKCLYVFVLVCVRV